MRLLRRADFHVGAHVNTFWRTPCRGAAEGPSKKSVVWENKHITWFGECWGAVSRGGGQPGVRGGRASLAHMASPQPPWMEASGSCCPCKRRPTDGC